MKMYNTEKIEKYAEAVFDRLNYFNDYTLKTIARRIKAVGQLSAADQQALKNISDITGDMNAITKKLADITRMNVADVEKMYTGTVTDGVNTYKPLYDLKNLPFVPFEQNEYAQQLVRNWAMQTAGEMINLSRTSALGFDKYDAFGNIIGHTPLEGTFEKAISGAVAAVSSSTTDFNTVMSKTVEELGGSGVKVTYGSGINRSLSAMVRQNILYGAKQSAQAYDDYISAELALDGAEIDAHPGCRPTHLVMQDGIYALSDKTVTVDGVEYKGLYEDIGYEDMKETGTVQGLLEDYVCLHFKTGVMLGVSEPRYSQEELEQIRRESTELLEYDGKKKTLFEWKQTQRRLERAAREKQTPADMFREAGNIPKTREKEKAVAAYCAKYDDMCEKLGLTPKLERMRTYKGSLGKTVDKGGKSGIIDIYRGVNMQIDKLTPCLENAKTREIVQTAYKSASKEELSRLEGWKFNWTDKGLENSEVYKLTLKDDEEIQGLVALTRFERDKAVYVNIVESAPHNLGKNKQYNGVGGHLYAIAVQKSIENGYGGFVFMDAKNMELVKHYKETLGATLLGHPHEYRMFIDEENAQKLVKIYTLKEE